MWGRGSEVVTITDLGQRVFLLSFSESRVVDRLHADQWADLRQWFFFCSTEVDRFLYGGVFRWVHIRGIPLTAWSSASFETIAGYIGSWIVTHPDSDIEGCYERVAVLVHVSDPLRRSWGVDCRLGQRSVRVGVEVTDSSDIPAITQTYSAPHLSPIREGAIVPYGQGRGRVSWAAESEIPRTDPEIRVRTEAPVFEAGGVGGDPIRENASFSRTPSSPPTPYPRVVDLDSTRISEGDTLSLGFEEGASYPLSRPLTPDDQDSEDELPGRAEDSVWAGSASALKPISTERLRRGYSLEGMRSFFSARRRPSSSVSAIRVPRAPIRSVRGRRQSRQDGGREVSSGLVVPGVEEIGGLSGSDGEWEEATGDIFPGRGEEEVGVLGGIEEGVEEESEGGTLGEDQDGLSAASITVADVGRVIDLLGGSLPTQSGADAVLPAGPRAPAQQ